MITITKLINGNVKVHFGTNNVSYLSPTADILPDPKIQNNIIISTLTEGNYSIDWNNVQQPLNARTFTSRQGLQEILAEDFFFRVKNAAGDMLQSVYDPAGKSSQLATDLDLSEALAAPQIFNGTTDDGSTNVLELKNFSGEIVEKIDTNGFYSTRYRDEYVSGRWTSAAGAAAPDEVNVTIGGIATRSYAFDGNNTEESMANHFELAHDVQFNKVNDGTLKIEVHTHFRPSTNNAGDVKWFFDWSYTPVDAAPIPMPTISYIKIIALNQLHYHLIAGAELPVPAGGFGLGGIITFNTRRNPNDVQDTYTLDDALFIKTALHVPTDGGGSRQRYVK